MGTIRVTLSDLGDLSTLETVWKALEKHAQPSVFQSWSWVNCWLKTPGVSPQLLKVRRREEIIGLALIQASETSRFFNAPKVYLQETGNPEIDALYIEYNNILTAPENLETVTKACLSFLTSSKDLGGNFRFSGVSAFFFEQLRTMPENFRTDQEGPSYFVDLENLRRRQQPYFDVLSRNTRQKLNRARRQVEKVAPIELTRAETTEEALAYLESLETLHQTVWRARGHPGAFQNTFFQSFHRRYIETSFNDGTIDLLRIHAGERTLGYLLNFVHSGVVYQYQSGIDYTEEHQHPGYLAHAAAIQYYLDTGLKVYNFMAGDNQQKSSLSTDREPLYWITLRRPSLALKLSDIIRHAFGR